MTLCLLPAGQPDVATAVQPPPSDSLAIGPHTRLVFADRSQAQQILMRRDRFVEQMTGLDRQLRLRDRQDPTEEDYLRFLGENAQDWSAVEMTAVRAALGPVTAKLAEYPRIWPPTILLVKTTSALEDGAPHCRQEAIVLPEHLLRQGALPLQRILVHELFHIASRHAPALRSQLYALIGFRECLPIPLPPPLQQRKITNPDAPAVDCVTTVIHDGQPLHLTPVLLSRHSVDELPRDTTIFRELDFRLVQVEADGSNWRVAGGQEAATRFTPRELPQWQAQIGRNTQYIIHPEEILADNFVHLILPGEPLPDPWLIEKLSEILRTP